MPAALLTFLLLAATIDPRLTEPLRLLAEVRTAVHDVTGKPIGIVPFPCGRDVCPNQGDHQGESATDCEPSVA